jgi:hypothetical protein
MMGLGLEHAFTSKVVRWHAHGATRLNRKAFGLRFFMLTTVAFIAAHAQMLVH